MASLYVSYYASVLNGCGANPLGSEIVTTSGTSAKTAAASRAVAAMLFSDVAHYVADGPDPTATSSNGVYIPANVPIWLSLHPGNKLAAITA